MGQGRAYPPALLCWAGGQAAAGGGCPDSRCASSYEWCEQCRVGLYRLLLFQTHFLLLLLLVKWWKTTIRIDL